MFIVLLLQKMINSESGINSFLMFRHLFPIINFIERIGLKIIGRYFLFFLYPNLSNVTS